MLSLLAAIFLGAAPAATALEVTARGQILYQFGVRENYHNASAASGFKSDEADHFFARQRARIMVDFIASENLRGVFQFQMGAWNWGDGGTALDTTSASPLVRQAYIAWTWPNSDFKTAMGLQHIALPSAVANNPMFNSIVAGVSASYELSGEFALSGFWARPNRSNEKGYGSSANPGYKDNDMDLFALVADWNTENFRLQPWLMYGRIGQDSGFWNRWGRDNGHLPINKEDTSDRYSNLYTGGIALQVNPTAELALGFDGMYGLLKNKADDTSGGVDRFSGFLLAAKADYRLSFGTPGAMLWYASGDDADDANESDGSKFGRMPAIGQGVFGFAPSRLAFAGAYVIGDERMLSADGTGSWGAGLYLKDVSVFEDISHVFRLVYFQGTNDKDVKAAHRLTPFNPDLYLTTKDKGFEVDFDTTWKLSNGLKLVMELGYVYMDWDDRINSAQYDKNNVWNAQITFDYSF